MMPELGKDVECLISLWRSILAVDFDDAEIGKRRRVLDLPSAGYPEFLLYLFDAVAVCEWGGTMGE